MKKLRIALCDSNKDDLEDYGKICRAICENNKIPVELNFYSSSHDLMFDMRDYEFPASVSIFIIDPENGFAEIPVAIRNGGYDGLILYLSHSNSLEYYRQAFDVKAYNFVRKSTDALSCFQSIFESALHTARKIDRQYMLASHAGQTERIEVKDIQYFESAEDHMINVVYIGGSFTFSSTMKNLEERFCDRGFIRVHRSYLVSVNAIHRMDFNELTLNNGKKISVSRDRFPALKSVMVRGQA